MLLTVTVERMRITANHGVMPQERFVGNEFEVSVSLTTDLDTTSAQALAKGDNIADTISYADVADEIRSAMAAPAALLETVALRLIESLRQRWPQTIHGSVTIAKLTPPIPRTSMASAAVTLTF